MGSGSSSKKSISTPISNASTCQKSGQPLSGNRVFDCIDKDSSGKLCLSELQDALRASFGFTDEEIETVFTIMDRDHDGEVDRAEFIAGFDKYEALSSGGVASRELLKIWASGTPDNLKNKRSDIVCGAASQCYGCPTASSKIGLLQHELPRFVFVGCSGSGKSSLCTAISSQDLSKGARESSSFKIGDGTKSETQICTIGEHQWLGTKAPEDRAIIIDTPGLNDSEGRDEQHIVAIIDAMKKLEYVTAIIFVVNSADPRFSKSLQDSVSRFENAFCGDASSADAFRDARAKSFYQNIVVCFQRWKMNEDAVADREDSGITEERLTSEFNAQFHEKFPHCRIAQRSIPCVFVDSHDRNLRRKEERFAAFRRILPQDTFRTADLGHILPRIVGYDAASQQFVRCQPILQMKPVLIEEQVNVFKWHVNPTLPAGLSMDSRGIISGTPSTAAPAVAISVVAEGSGGRSEVFKLSIEVQLNENDIDLELLQHVSKFDPSCLLTNQPNSEEELSGILKSLSHAAEICLSQSEVELQRRYTSMLQLPMLLAKLELNLTSAKIHAENHLRDKHQFLVKESLQLDLAMQKADFEVQTLLDSCILDHTIFRRSVKYLEQFQPPVGSLAALTLQRGLEWLDGIEQVPCSVPNCPCVCLKKDVALHEEMCLFSIPLMPRTAVQLVDCSDCNNGFILSVIDASNLDLTQYTGTFQPGPCSFIEDDQPDWFHCIDTKKRRIIRIKREIRLSAFQSADASSPNPWILSVWEHSGQESDLVKGATSSVVDGAKFPGFGMSPLKVVNEISDPSSRTTLRRDSIKLMYFGAEWCPFCPPFLKKLKSFFNIICESIGNDLLEVIYCSSDRSADAMISYFGMHHGDWFAIPFKERAWKGKLSAHHDIEGIPSLRIVRNSGEALDQDVFDLTNEIRQLSDNDAAAKLASLDLFKRLQEAYLADHLPTLPKRVKKQKKIKLMSSVRTNNSTLRRVEFLPDDGEEYQAIANFLLLPELQKKTQISDGNDIRLVGDPKDFRTGRFGVAARGLPHYLNIGPHWHREALSIAGMREEISLLKDCPDCAEVQAGVFEAEMQRHTEADATRRLAKALKELKSCRDSPHEDASKLIISAAVAVSSIRDEMDRMEYWYYGSKATVQWPPASVQMRSSGSSQARVFNQPMCERCMQYRLDHTSDTADVNYEVSEPASEATFWNGVRDKGRAGKKLDDFMKSKEVQDCDLSVAEVASLRFYTSQSFEAINAPLRDEMRNSPHPLPATVLLIQSGLKRLRVFGCDDKKSKSTEVVVLWRGASNIAIPELFLEEGGTELAPMSTTTDLAVALRYAFKGLNAPALLFRIVSLNSLTRGCDLQWLSMFPGESENLFPPLTFIQPTGNKRSLALNGCQVTVVEVASNLA